jgi:hypothetical protein
MNEELDVFDDGYVERETLNVSKTKPMLTEDRAEGIAHFIKYNNTIPIVLGVIFLGTTGALAASPEVRGAVYSSSESVKSVDNSYLRAVNVNGFPFTVQITNVREDTDTYYVSYNLHTIDLVDSVWRPVDKKMELTVLKSDLRNENLGTYTSRQVAQVRDYERYRFTLAQQEELKKGPSQKVVSTAYSGLVGSFLGTHDEVIPGYAIPETVADGNFVPEGSDPNHLSSPQALLASESPSSETQTTATQSTGDSLDKTPPVVSMLGTSNVTVTIGNPYTDLGALATDDYTPNPSLKTYVNNSPVGKVVIDTSTPGFYTILYRAEDNAHNVGTATRTVNVISGDVTPAPQPAEPAPPTPDTAPPTAPSASTP